MGMEQPVEVLRAQWSGVQFRVKKKKKFKIAVEYNERKKKKK